MSKKILVTGADGFIGSHLARALAERNQVFIYDDLSSGRLRNIQGLDADLIEGSLSDLDRHIERLLADDKQA